MFFGSVVGLVPRACLALASRFFSWRRRASFSDCFFKASNYGGARFRRCSVARRRVFVYSAVSCVCARPPSFLCLVCKGTTKETKRQSETRNYFALNFVKTTRPPHPAAPSALILKSLWLAEKTGSVPVVRGMLPVVCAMLPVAPPRQPTTSEKRMPSAPAIWRKVDSCMSVCPCSRAEI